jgi:hypothetical protein
MLFLQLALNPLNKHNDKEMNYTETEINISSTVTEGLILLVYKAPAPITVLFY